MSLREPNGSRRSIVVDQRVEGFKHIKVGGGVVLNITKAFWLAVEKPEESTAPKDQ